MRRKNYLNGILTINAVLLSGLLWVQVANEPLMSNEASAQQRSTPSRVQIPPNAASQRQKIIDEIKKLSRSVEAMKKQMESGTVKVEVTNIDQLTP